MAPFPEEVDVFTEPHSRMNYLVKRYSDKLAGIDFKDNRALASLLDILHSTFIEFQCHEQIENEYIMEKLNTKLEDLCIKEATVCNCHKDSRLADMFCLLNYGYNCKNDVERLNFGLRLQKALHEFTDDFLPHMKEEEEVFQPLLIKYFKYDELRSMKELVIREHYKSQHHVKPLPVNLEPVIGNSFINHLPAEIRSHIFSYLGPKDLLRASMSCRLWRGEIFHPRHWKIFEPRAWLLKGTWTDFDHSHSILPNPTLLNGFTNNALVTEGLESLLNWAINILFPRVGLGIRVINLSGCCYVPLDLFREVLLHCPNVEIVNFSYTKTTDSTFDRQYEQKIRLEGFKSKVLKLEGKGSKVHTLILQGCIGIGDRALLNISSYLGKNQQLKTLDLSGCCLITDQGLSNLLGSLANVKKLNLSGCWQLSAEGLQKLCDTCPELEPENIFYCDFIEGPYKNTRNGCQNLETSMCCSLFPMV